MSDRIIQGFSEMKDIYLTQILIEEKKGDYDHDGVVEPPKKERRDSRNNAIRKALGEPPEDNYEPDEREDEKQEDKDEKPKRKHKKHKEEKEDEEMQAESFSNWRSDLYEVISKLEPKVRDIDNDEITEKKVVNKVVLNPVVTEKFALIGEQELDEEFLLETSSVAAEYFANLGLNEHGLEMVIDYLGEDKFIEYVFYVTEDYLLTEARRSGRIEPVTREGKPIGTLTRGKASAITSRRNAKAAHRKEEERQQASKPSGLTAALKSQSEVAKKVTKDRGDQAVKAAAQQQKGGALVHVPKKAPAPKYVHVSKPSSDDATTAWARTALERQQKGGALVHVPKKAPAPTKPSSHDEIKKLTRGIYSTLKGATQDALSRDQRGKAALKKAKSEGKGIGGQIGAVLKAAWFKPEFREWIEYLMVEGYDLQNYTLAELSEQYTILQEKAVSEQQQKIFGLALAVKRGEVSRSKVSDKVLEIVDGMSEAEIRKFASTKHKGIPHRK